MASPLSWFRRNQKGMLVVFGVLLMAAFGMEGVFNMMQPANPGAIAEDRVVVKYDNGYFTESQLAEMRFRNAELFRFLEDLQNRSRVALGDKYTPRVPRLNPLPYSGDPEELNREVMQHFLLLRQAKEYGIKIGDQSVLEYLRGWADDLSLTEAKLDQVCFEMYNGRIEFGFIKSLLKNELAINQVRQISERGLLISPNLTESWETYLKLNRKIECTIVKRPIEDYLAQVTEQPSEAELKALYDEGKEVFPSPSKQTPAFKNNRKVSAVLISARFNDFLQREAAKVTPEAVQAEYDKLVAANDPMVIELIPETTPETETGNEAGNENSDDAPPTLDIEGDENGADIENTSEMGESSGESTDSESNENSAGDQENQDGDENSDNDAAEQDDESHGPAPVSLSQRPQLMLASTAQPVRQENDEQSGEEGAEGQPQEEDLQTPDESTGEETSAEPTDPAAGSETEAGGDDQTEPTDPNGNDSGDTDSNDSGIDLTDLPDDEPKTRVKPLDETLSQQIKERLATGPALRALEDAINEVSIEIAVYGGDYAIYLQTKDGPKENRFEEPEPIDFKAFAEKHKLNYQVTEEPLDYFELVEHPVGSPQVLSQNAGRFPAYVANFIFGNYHRLGPFQSEVVDEHRTLNKHIFFIEEKVEAKVPTFEEAREDIEAYWRYQKAVALAQSDLEQLASQLKQNNENLIDRVDDAPMLSGGFSWIDGRGNFPSVGQDFLNKLETGEEFMTTAFALPLNDYGVAVDGSFKYMTLIQKTKEEERDVATLQKSFFESIAASQGMPWNYRSMRSGNLYRRLSDWFDEQEKKYDVNWVAY